MASMRGLSQETLNGLSAGIIFPVSLVAVEWSDGNTYRFHTGFGTINWDGHDWLPTAVLSNGEVFQVGKIELPDESMSIASVDANLKIAASLDALLKAQSEYGRGLSVSFYFGTVTEPSGNILVDEPFITFSGITSGNGLNHIVPDFNIQVTSGVRARASASMVHSTEDQQSRYPNDTLFDRQGVARKWEEKGLQWPE